MDTIIFKIDKDLKQLLKKKCEKDGITLSSFFRALTKALVNGDVHVDLVVRPAITKKILSKYL